MNEDTVVETQKQQQQLEEDSADEQLYIKKFSQKLIREKCGNYPLLKRSIDGKIVYPETNGITSNRGNKLLQKSELVTRTNINNTKPIDEECIFYNGSEHNLLQRKRMRFNIPPLDSLDVKGPNTIKLGDEDEDDDDDEYNLNKLVDISKTLSPISSLSDISTKDSISHVYKSKILKELALQTILMVEKEQDSVNKYTKLLEVLLGNLVDPLHQSNLNLKDYDHKLLLEESDNENDPENSTANNTTINEDEEDSNDNKNNNPVDFKEGRQEDHEDEDPFFAIPKVDVLTKFDEELDPKNSKKDAQNNTDIISSYSLSYLTKEFPNHEQNMAKIHEELETSRQLSQIALQRNQEFIRNLSKIRNYLIKANRIKERIYSWSKEIGGIQEEGILIPSLLRDAKRGLIRITTNKTLDSGDEEENPDEEQEEE
ncbi:hypothetical protein TPHA_0M01490 [Tetrapisispora phaffii CBS 4417]|uniref:Transcriptional regulatory protein RXT2 N-terminal domain-containing protein n=1 Tax=Tetrapisispora phaffii (strain ATCC 24235 / CBS 4417 / NBRC 1672 / NRRL Y-8282 / UCD 70-5) TaxID=1071381 RepID=G8C0K9_TETPH|nr:hypothetical protein TPHA_0M01490 [Tetrapisispora phaffii CBS 4417]CCE65724.1 hypothetical protein TPHA_0M01490 [Tetrapisispora phaffii CBS 4417]